MSTAAESAEKKKGQKKKGYEQLCEERFYLHLINERYT